VLAPHADQTLLSPESLQLLDTILILGANGTLILTVDAGFTPECRAERPENLPPKLMRAELDSQNDSLAEYHLAGG
jgi:hypothetical protein